MTTIFRTYGYWYLEYATKYLPSGFNIKSDSGNQIYRGYDWEIKYPNIKKAALETTGIIAMYKKEIALTPYSSWSDGRTRSFKERWGSSDYPWCKSVKDPYGKHSSMTTKQLEAAGNHMVGLVGYGSVKLADKYKWSYKKIMTYYYTGINLTKKY
jgi:SpoIID/LytB domain protein